LVMNVVRKFGSQELRDLIGPGVDRGEIQCCLGYTEPDCGSDAAAIRTRAISDGDEWIISGQKMFSTGAHVCQYAMVTTRTNPDAPKHQGITMFLVPLESPGIEVQGIATLGGERTNFIYFDEARVPDWYRLGPIDKGWQVASGALAEEHGMGEEKQPPPDADISDIVDALKFHRGWRDELSIVLAEAVAWARTSRRPDGTYEIDHQSVRSRLAQVALHCAVIDVTPDPYGRVIASEFMIGDTAELISLAGASGLLVSEEDGAAAGGALEWAHRYAQGTAIYGGTTDIQRNLIAEQYLGLPNHRGVVRR